MEKPMKPARTPDLQPMTAQSAKEYLKAILDLGEYNSKQLEEELRAAKVAKRTAVAEYDVCSFVAFFLEGISRFTLTRLLNNNGIILYSCDV